jgi:TrpR-related protein YerC/YecD
MAAGARDLAMTLGPDEWRTQATDDLLDAIVAIPDREAAARFLRDLCTLGELRDLAQRWHVVQLLDAGRHYADIARESGASTATITRVAQWLHHGTGGYREALARRTAAAAAPTTPRRDHARSRTR